MEKGNKNKRPGCLFLVFIGVVLIILWLITSPDGSDNVEVREFTSSTASQTTTTSVELTQTETSKQEEVITDESMTTTTQITTNLETTTTITTQNEFNFMKNISELSPNDLGELGSDLQVVTIDKNVDISEYAISAYQTYCDNSGKILILINYANKESICIAHLYDDVYDVEIHKYQEGEETDYNKAGYGEIINEYYVSSSGIQ